MAQTEPVQHASNARAMHNDAALCKLEAQFVKRQITVLSHTFTWGNRGAISSVHFY